MGIFRVEGLRCAVPNNGLLSFRVLRMYPASFAGISPDVGAI